MIIVLTELTIANELGPRPVVTSGLILLVPLGTRYVYIYIHLYKHIYTYIYIYTYINLLSQWDEGMSHQVNDMIFVGESLTKSRSPTAKKHPQCNQRWASQKFGLIGLANFGQIPESYHPPK